MGIPQGDGLGEPVYYSHPDHADLRPAFVPADHVNFKARGWAPVETELVEAEPETASEETERPAGSQRRETARVVRRSVPAEDAAEGSNA